MNIGYKIKMLRKKSGLTQEQLGKKLSVAATAVSAWERGLNRPLMDKLTVLSHLFEVPVSYFFETSDHVFKDSSNDELAEAYKELNEEERKFLEELIEKTLSLGKQERENFLANVRFAVEYFDKGKK